ncbi:MarR family winged helix-turn-helix transcriptional regulator [Cytobacillus firmus]|uniref:MarR family winged helix-turn-helix transcriptional regulator n=1 Tax=Cytobacillus firmus TaxID=1399 RepID=UPI0018CD06B8|nr:MarR family transcriptional regulator [Cytobacillus firmus]MBG9587602.1 MarR family transcriptional regulator [Cytobacillus firmus]
MLEEEINKYWSDIYYHLHYPHNDKITHQAVRILQLVDKEKTVGISEISQNLNISHNTASDHVKRMILKGYLTKKRDIRDERKVSISLTNEGKEILHKNTLLNENKLKEIFKKLSLEEKTVVQEGFKLLWTHVKKSN